MSVHKWIFNLPHYARFSSQLFILYLVIRPALENLPETRMHSERSTRTNRISRCSARPFEILMTRSPLCNYHEANGHAKRKTRKKGGKKITRISTILTFAGQRRSQSVCYVQAETSSGFAVSGSPRVFVFSLSRCKR